MKRNALRLLIAALALTLSGSLLAADGSSPATVVKPKVDVHAAPSFSSPAVTTLQRNASVNVTGQEGLWLKLALGTGQTG